MHRFAVHQFLFDLKATTYYIILIFSFIVGTTSCSGPKPKDPCNLYAEALNGAFSSKFMIGTITFDGGTRGFMTAEGQDFNDMDCGYVIIDCNEGIASMNCDGAPHETTIQVISMDTIKITGETYIRVK